MKFFSMFFNFFRFCILFFFTVASYSISGQVLEIDSPETNGMSTDRLSHINTVFSDYVAQGKLP